MAELTPLLADARSRASIAITVAVRVGLIGAAAWLVVPPTDPENFVRAAGGSYLLLVFWWYRAGPIVQGRWGMAFACGAWHLIASIMFAHVLVRLAGSPLG